MIEPTLEKDILIIFLYSAYLLLNELYKNLMRCFLANYQSVNYQFSYHLLFLLIIILRVNFPNSC